MDTQTQIDRLIELAIIQRTELKQLVEQLPQLREHLNAEVEKVFEETEPQLRSELEEWTTKQTADKTAALGVALEAKIANLAKSLEISTQARYNAIIAEREENARLAAQAEAKIAEHAASLPSAVKEIVSAELARFPRAGEIDQLRKEFAEPRGLNPRGKWQAGETYNRLDLVTYNGDSFVSNIDGNKERPSRSATNWTLNAARGMGGGSGFTSLNNVLGDPSAGQIVGSEGGQYVRKTLVAGANITINETASSITIIGDEGQISLQDGTAAAPSLFFTSDTDTGLYRPAANTLGVAVGGAQVAYFDANGITTVGAGATFDGSVHAANGNANNPSLSFTSDDNTGFFRHQPDEIGITLGGTQTGTLTSALATLTSKLLVSSGATTTAATDLLVNPAVKASGNLLDLQVASSSKFSVSSAGNATFGGNLTVSGTGTSSFAGTLLQRSSTGVGAIASIGTDTGSYSVLRVQNTATSGRSFDIGTAGSGDATLGSKLYIYDNTAGATRWTMDSSGNIAQTGNLTVSGGTIGTAASTNLTLAGGSSGASLALGQGTTGTFTFTLPSINAGSTTWVSAGAAGIGIDFKRATATATLAGTLASLNGYNGATRSTIFEFNGDGATDSGRFDWWVKPTAGSLTQAMVLKSSGNLLLGTTTDSGNGKLQLATHTTSAGGIGFGTDVSLYRDGTGYLSLYGPNADTTFRLWGGATQLFRITNSSTISYVQNLTGSLQLASNGITALTLDSSQRTILSGALRLNNAYTASAVVPTGYVTIQDSTGTTYKVCVLL